MTEEESTVFFITLPARLLIWNIQAGGGAAYFENIESLRYLFASDGFKRLSDSSHNAGVYFVEYPNAQKDKKTERKNQAFLNAMSALKFRKLLIDGDDELFEVCTILLRPPFNKQFLELHAPWDWESHRRVDSTEQIPSLSVCCERSNQAAKQSWSLSVQTKRIEIDPPIYCGGPGIHEVYSDKCYKVLF